MARSLAVELVLSAYDLGFRYESRFLISFASLKLMLELIATADTECRRAPGFRAALQMRRAALPEILTPLEGVEALRERSADTSCAARPEVLCMYSTTARTTIRTARPDVCDNVQPLLGGGTMPRSLSSPSYQTSKWTPPPLPPAAERRVDDDAAPVTMSVVISS